MTSRNVKRLYASVLEDVIEGVKEAFLDEGISGNVLSELQDLWQSKMIAMDAIRPEDCSAAARHLFDLNKPNVPTPPVFPTDATTLIPIEIKYCVDSSTKFTTIEVPASCVANNKIEEVLKEPEIKAALANPPGNRSIQDLVLAALGEPSGSGIQADSITQLIEKPSVSGRISRVKETKGRVGGNTRKTKRKISKTVEALDYIPESKTGKTEASVDVPERRTSLRSKATVNYTAFLDGGVAEMSSDEDSSDTANAIGTDNDVGSETDDAADDSDKVDDEDDETPLNSDDDDPDFEGMDDEVENMIVCQYEKITRSRNKWKFQLKDGIMSINGTDEVFQNALGYAEW